LIRGNGKLKGVENEPKKEEGEEEQEIQTKDA
jgi:hypothetical protein